MCNELSSYHGLIMKVIVQDITSQLQSVPENNNSAVLDCEALLKAHTKQWYAPISSSVTL